MDQELKQYLDGKFAEVDTKFVQMDTRFAAIDTKFVAIDTKFVAIDTKFVAIDTKFATKLDLERFETAVLTGFRKWVSTVDARTRSHTSALRAIELKMERLTGRVQKLENEN